MSITLCEEIWQRPWFLFRFLHNSRQAWSTQACGWCSTVSFKVPWKLCGLLWNWSSSHPSLL